MKNKKILWLQLLTAAVVLAIIEFVVRIGWVNELYLASPSSTLKGLIELFARGKLIYHFSVTLAEFFIGFSLAAIVGISFGLFLAISRKAEIFFTPFLSALMSIPKSAIIPLLILWLGIGFANKVFVAFLAGFFVITFNTLTGVKGTPENLIKVGKVFEATRRQMIWKILLPAAVPSIFTGLRLAATLGLVMTLFSEMFASKVGLGNLLTIAVQYYNTPQLFAIIVVVTLLSVAITQTIHLLEVKIFSKWRGTDA